MHRGGGYYCETKDMPLPLPTHGTCAVKGFPSSTCLCIPGNKPQCLPFDENRVTQRQETGKKHCRLRLKMRTGKRGECAVTLAGKGIQPMF